MLRVSDSPTSTDAASASSLPPTVVRLGWLSFSLDVATEMSYPIVPLFLAATLKSSGSALGVIEGTAEGLLSIVTALTGRQSDRIRKRVPFIRVGYGLTAISKPLIALAQGWPFVLAMRSADRLGKGVRTAARDALIADVTAPDQRGRAFGFHRAMDTAGAFVGVLLAAFFLHLWPGEYRWILGLTAIPGVAAIAIAFTVTETPRTEPGSTANLSSTASPAAKPRREKLAVEPGSVRELPAGFWRAVIVLWIFAIGNSSDAFLLLRARDQGFGDIAVVLAYAFYNFVYAGSSYPAGVLSDRVGRTRLITVGWIVFAVVYAGFAVLGGAHIWWLFAVYGVYMGIVDGVSKALIADFAPAELQGTAMGVYRLGLGVATISSSAIAGLLWDRVSHAAPFWMGAIVAALAIALVPWLLRRTNTS